MRCRKALVCLDTLLSRRRSLGATGHTVCSWQWFLSSGMLLIVPRSSQDPQVELHLQLDLGSLEIFSGMVGRMVHAMPYTLWEHPPHQSSTPVNCSQTHGPQDTVSNTAGRSVPFLLLHLLTALLLDMQSTSQSPDFWCSGCCCSTTHT